MSAKKRFLSRRDFLFRAGEGISGLALAHMLQQDGLLAAETACDTRGIASPTAPRDPHFKPRAKAVISLFMSGGVSHVDTFDHKPMLAKFHGKPLTGKGKVRVRQGFPGPLMRSPFKFERYGECGKQVSELFPHMGAMVDDLAFVHSLQRPVERPCPGALRVEHGFGADGSPERRELGHLRPRLGESEPAGIRGGLRSPRRALFGPGELEQRVSSGHLPRHGVPFAGRSDS